MQRFGENPQIYSSLHCGGVPMHGHNGIDFATPPGTPVLAVHNGVVLDEREDPAGLGHYVLLGHRWGQSIYGHLSERRVVRGQQVGGGHLLGLSGSGAGRGPHLHFGMRISPFSIADGWCGYSDPAPYLARLAKPRGALIGPHIIAGIQPHLEVLARWQPRLITVLDPNPAEMRALRQACPHAVVVARIYAPDHEIEERIRANPQDAARWAHEQVMAHMTHDVDYWQFANETLQDSHSLPLMCDFELARMALADVNGYRCAILAFSVGNPDLPEEDRLAHWRLVYPALEYAETWGHIVAVHQYGMPDLWGPDNAYDWYIYRLEHQILRRLPYKRLQFAVTEFGIDGLIRGTQPAGWQTFTTAEGYVDQLLKAARYLERFSGRVLGYCVFTLGHHAPWDTYNIAGVAADLLADRSQRGVWREVDAFSIDFLPGEADFTTDPGGDVVDSTPGGEPGGEEPGEKEPGEGSGPGGKPRPPLVPRRLAPRFQRHNMTIKSILERPDTPGGDPVYLIKDIFTTVHGSWEQTGGVDDVPQWARDAYLKPEFMEAGANHHLFAAVLGLDGSLVKNQEVIFWSDGFARLGDPNYSAYIRVPTKEDSGWANLFMAGSSSFAPERGESGPWCWTPSGAAEVICGGGLPNNQLVSTFVVWQAVTRADWQKWLDEGEEEDEPGEEPGEGDEPGEEPGEGDEPGEEEPGKPILERRLSPWIASYNIRIKTLAERPKLPEEEVVYLIKDIFTTRWGSWEPTDEPGSVPQWARDAYLKPTGDPDFFDDAGGDHHLFAAAIGLDGKLERLREFLYWSDGFEMINDPTYNAYVRRLTKERSGWANIIIGPGSNFSPEQGESGPWCWTPSGAAEVICGGGLPNNNHISTFVVWQAVRRDDLSGGRPGLDYSIYLPYVVADAPPVPQGLPVPTMPKARALGPEERLAVRQATWLRVGFEQTASSPLAEYARRIGLGMPVTQEFSTAACRVQGFFGGIVFAPLDDLSAVTHMSW
jgi:hypothetical protein